MALFRTRSAVVFSRTMRIWEEIGAIIANVDSGGDLSSEYGATDAPVKEERTVLGLDRAEKMTE
jgi:hypothetical protein